MIHEVILPKLGTNMEEGIIAEWRKEEGDYVRKGEPVLLVETSKALFEVESEFDGFLRKRLFREGERVQFTEPVAVLTDTPQENINKILEGYKEKKDQKKRYHQKKREELWNKGSTLTRRRRADTLKIPVTPSARRLIEEHELDTSMIYESIGGGVIEERHVRNFVEKKRIAIYGAGLGCKQVRELLGFHDDLICIGLFDDNETLKDREILEYKVLGGWKDFVEYASNGKVDGVIVSLHSEHRKKILERIQKETPYVELISLIDKRAIISMGVLISGGVFIETGAIIGTDTFLGCGVIVDMGSVVSHDCYIGDYSHLSPGCHISGVVRLEGNVLVGAGASINSQVTIGRNVVITPGSAVVSDIPDDVVVTGNPARIIGKSFRGR